VASALLEIRRWWCASTAGQSLPVRAAIAGLMAQGLTNQEGRLRHAFMKIDIRPRVELARVAADRGNTGTGASVTIPSAAGGSGAVRMPAAPIASAADRQNQRETPALRPASARPA